MASEIHEVSFDDFDLSLDFGRGESANEGGGGVVTALPR